MTKIAVIFYSMTGNVAKLKEAIASGAKEQGAKVRIRQVEEIIPKEKWNEKMREVKEELKDIKIASKDDLVWADGIAFGTPTRYGNWSAQMKSFLDDTGDLWQQGKLVDKVATIFTSASTQHGGHESTVVTSIPLLLHHGMIIIGIPYTVSGLSQMDNIAGGGPYGASSTSGPGADRAPLESDKAIAKEQGRRLAMTAGRLAGG